MFAFLRSIVAIQSFDGHEGEVVRRIQQEMDKVGFDRTEIDPMGNLLGYIGHGSHLIAFDGHCDTVSYGDKANWKFDPFLGTEDEATIGGLGSTDQKGGIAAMVYAGLALKELGLLGDYTLLMTASVQEEDADGLCWQYIIEKDGKRPEFAVLTEPSDGMVRNGQRGRMEIKITTRGLSSHGSTPELGVNAVYKMAPIIGAIERLNGAMIDDGILGKGSVTISETYSTSPSRCAVADSCTISLDRRLNAVETPEFAMKQLRSLPEVAAAKAEVELYSFDDPSWTGLVYKSDKFYPSWIVDKDAEACACVVGAYTALFGKPPVVKPWMFSTNGVAIMGRHGIPCVGFGPGHVDQAHHPNEVTWKQELVDCCAVYAAVPLRYR